MDARRHGGPQPPHAAALRRIRCTAPHFRLVNVEGEPGTGKLLAAQTLHRLGPASSGPFVPCTRRRIYRRPKTSWTEASAGLLYFARVDELSPDQQRILRDFIERAAHERIRAAQATAPLQIVAGSLQPLRRLAATGAFRSDLASHLTAIRFAMPPLRDRKEDIPLLAGLFLRNWSQQHQSPLRGFAAGVLPRLAAHTWPGNVRELESVAIAAAALECTGQWIRPIDIPRSSGRSSPSRRPRPRRPLLRRSPPRPRHPSSHRSHSRPRQRQQSSRRQNARHQHSTLYRLLDPTHPPSPHEASPQEASPLD